MKYEYTEKIEKSECYMEAWKAAVRCEIWERIGISLNDPLTDFELGKKQFDYDCQLGIMCAMNILTQNIEQFKWPENWREAFKERWFPKWLLKRYPVKYTGIDVKAIYPKAELPHPIFKAQRMSLDLENHYKKDKRSSKKHVRQHRKNNRD